MAICPNCGEQMSDSGNVCMSCGTSLPVSESVSQEPPFAQEEPPCAQEALPELSFEPEEKNPVDDVQRSTVGEAFAQQPRKRNWLAIVVICGIALLAAALIGLYLLFGAGKKTVQTDHNLGIYVGTQAVMLGVDVDIREILGDVLVIELKENGACRVTGGGQNGNGTWSLDGNIITIEDGTTTFNGTLEDGTMQFENMMDMGFDITFYQADDELSADEVVDAPNVDIDWWNDDWYGYWSVSSCDGVYESLENGWWDSCAAITVDEDGNGQILLWAEDFPRDDPLSEINFVVSEEEGSGEMGVAAAKNGYFFGMNVFGGGIVIDPSLYEYENMLCLKGRYETNDGSFAFNVYLRPWGQIWDDVEEDNGLLPYYYDRYLSAVENGESLPDDITAAWNE